MSSQAVSAAEYRERTVKFGRNTHLRGILTLPRDSTPSACMLMFNSGILSRIGASRMQVDMARELCRLNVASLRFDLSGLGSSELPAGTADIQDIVNADLDDARGFIDAEIPDVPIVGVGLCSGAYDLLQAMQRGAGLKGAVLIDLPGDYGNLQHLGRHYLRRIGNLENWTRAISQPARSVSALQKRLSANKSPSLEEGDSSEIGVRPTSCRASLGQAMEKVNIAGGHLYFVFTGGMGEYYNYESQFADLFPQYSKLPQIHWAYLEEADHTFTRQQDRSQLTENVAVWLRELGLVQ